MWLGVAIAATIAGVALLRRPLEQAIVAASPSVLATAASAAIVLIALARVAFVRSRRAHDKSRGRELRTLRETTLLLQDRAGELEVLMRLGESLAQALNPESLKKVIIDHLQPLVPGHDLWLSTKESGWEPMIGSRRLQRRPGGAGPREATWHTFPLISQQKLVGVLGVRHDHLPLTDEQREILHAAAALLTVAVKNVQLFRKVRDLAVVEPLTGCVTRHHGIERLGAELRRAQRSHMPLSIVMLDLDHFKAVNDRQGHLCGDQVLVGVGRILRETLRVSDERCRYGGEEFLLVLPDTTAEGAARLPRTFARASRPPPCSARAARSSSRPALASPRRCPAKPTSTPSSDAPTPHFTRQRRRAATACARTLPWIRR